MKNNVIGNLKSVAGRLIELRTFFDYSEEELAEKLNIDVELYRGYESGKNEIPINLIYKFASLLGAEPGYIITGNSPLKDDAVVVYSGQGIAVQRYDGYSFTALATDFKKKSMNPMLVEIEPTSSPELVVHGGQEFNYVIEGDLRVIVGDKEYFLREGDSIFFDPSIPHAQVPMNNRKAKFLTVINE